MKFWPTLIGGMLVAAGPLGLWDVARHQAERRQGHYDLPFGVAAVPWWFAGDLFIAVTWLGVFLMGYGILSGTQTTFVVAGQLEPSRIIKFVRDEHNPTVQPYSP